MSRPPPQQPRGVPPTKAMWAPLRRRLFRALWIAQLVANTGTWMQTVGAQWLMGDLGGDALDIALVQTATALPIFLLVVPAGALGDILDRRRLLLVSQVLTFAGAAALAVLTAADAVTRPLLLTLTGLMAVGQAFAVPTFQAIQPELVSLDEIPQAALLNGANGNVARAIGPALGGALISVAGPEATFALNALSFLGVMLVLYVWKRPPDHRPLGAEHIRDAIRAGARYVRSAPEFAAVLWCSVMFTFCASGMWALLPALARGPLGLGAGGYGVLLAGVGAGAVAGAFALPVARGRMGPNTVVAGSTICYALAMAVISTVEAVPVVIAALVAAGLAWIAVLSTLNAAAQLLLPEWARARSLAYYQLVFMGGQAVGALVWGLVAESLSLRAAFLVPAAVLILSTPIGVLRVPLPTARFDMRQVRHYPEPPSDMEHNRGPLLVVVEWHVDPANAEAFLQVMQQIGRARRRTGATMWSLFEDMEEPTLYVETFTIQTAHEHLRQHVERGTARDQELDLQALRLVMEGTYPEVRHLIWAYAPTPGQEAKEPELRSIVSLLRPR
ncbi:MULTISPECIES: MFS transporter [Streptosporangium]|uniref:MFS family permease n=1 Tax=Streptosporangium brasiliense TaxID=47480 RepID=A0ABT9QYK9_9ACTN|nr:MFS transporter [Streptosporangium brasiliense]MDP9862077.1 MFS family permease [Streptosporangium brasiliense]